MMPKCSAIQEYYLCRQGARLADGGGTSNDDLRLMLFQNRRMLETIHRQCRPRFWFNVAANLTADAIFEAALRLGSKLCKL